MEYFKTQYRIILLSYKPAKKHFPLPEEIVHIYIDKTSPSNHTQRIATFVQKTKAEFYIGNDNLEADALAVYPLLKDSSTKTIMLNHNAWLFPYKWEASPSKALKKRNEILDDPDVILYLNESSALLCEKLCHRKIGVMPNPNSFNQVNYTPERSREKLVLALGRFNDWVKRIDRTLEIFSALAKIDSEVKFCVVGPFDLSIQMEPQGPTLKEILQNLELPFDRIEFVPETQDVSKYLHKAKVMVFTSISEAFSMTMTEAGVYGIPIVAHYFPEIEDIVIDGENGYIFNHTETDTMALKIKKLLNDKNLWNNISHRSLELSQRFSEERVMNKWQQLFNALLTSHSRSDLEKLLEEAGIIHTNQMSEFSMQSVIAEYEESLSQIINRLCRCDDCIDLLAAQQIKLNERIQELEHQLTIEQNKVSKNPASKKHFGLFKLKDQATRKRL